MYKFAHIEVKKSGDKNVLLACHETAMPDRTGFDNIFAYKNAVNDWEKDLIVVKPANKESENNIFMLVEKTTGLTISEWFDTLAGRTKIHQPDDLEFDEFDNVLYAYYPKNYNQEKHNTK